MTMTSLSISLEVGGKKYIVQRDSDGVVTIGLRNPSGQFYEFVGKGRWEGMIVDCAADIGEEAYSAMDAAIKEWSEE